MQKAAPVVANTSTQTSSINSDETWTIRPDPGAISWTSQKRMW